MDQLSVLMNEIIEPENYIELRRGYSSLKIRENTVEFSGQNCTFTLQTLINAQHLLIQMKSDAVNTSPMEETKSSTYPTDSSTEKHKLC